MLIQFNLDGEHVNRNKWAYENGYIEGDFTIYMNGDVLFEETYMNVLELAIQLGVWLADIEAGHVRDFEYDSIDCEDCLLAFYMKETDVQIQVFEGEFTPVVPLEIVKRAVRRYMIALNIELHRRRYMDNLDRFLHGMMSPNQVALMLFESNSYEAAFGLLKKLAYQTPSVQSLNNLAYMYLREEEKMEKAEELLQQVLTLQPQSAFPYNMLGEIALHNGAYTQAKVYLEQALAFEEQEGTLYNLALAHFHVAEYKEAAHYFSRCRAMNGQVKLHEILARIYAGERAMAKDMLTNWQASDEDDVSAIEIADMYIELGCFLEAREQFEKEVLTTFLSPSSTARFAYMYQQLQDEASCRKLIAQMRAFTVAEIEEEEQTTYEDALSQQHQKERLHELRTYLHMYDSLFEQLKQGDVPPFEYDMYPYGGCQLFGCLLHGHAEYKEHVEKE